MARPNRSAERRRELIPLLAETFAELGYRRATTAELAERCGVQETALYRLWPDKRAMFIAAIEHVYDLSRLKWDELLAASGDGGRSSAERLLAYESTHHGEFGLYRIVFAGLSEVDDPQIHDALARMYRSYHEFIARRLGEHRSGGGQRIEVELCAWALLGLGTMANIGRSLDLLGAGERRALWERVGRALIEGWEG